MAGEVADRLAELVGRFPCQEVLVVGDLVADEYIFCRSHRVSREAPVLILKYKSRKICLGGAANAAHNVRSLGGKVRVVGILGDDARGVRLRELMAEKGMDVSGVVEHKGQPTTAKIRILASAQHTTFQQVVRVDEEYEGNTERVLEEELLQRLNEVLPRVDGVLVSDYGYGVVSPRVRERILTEARAGKLVVVDSRYGLERYCGVTAVAPNEVEAQEVLGRKVDDEASVASAARELQQRLQVKGVVITRGRRGMAVFEDGGEVVFVPVFGTDEVADVTGAGDTVAGTLTLALAAGGGLVEAARVANCAAGVVVTKSGTATVEQEELLEALGRIKTGCG